VQHDTERRLKRTRLHSEREAEPAVEKQQQEQHDKPHMLLPPNPLGTTGKIDDASRHQHRSEAEEPAEETRSLLQTTWEQVVLDVDVETASMGLELEAEHGQWKEAVAVKIKPLDEY
jgi:hypothetical protein